MSFGSEAMYPEVGGSQLPSSHRDPTKCWIAYGMDCSIDSGGLPNA